jgi:hypothetical protein
MLDNVFLSFAKEAEEEGILPSDIEKVLKILKKYRK